MTKEESRIIYSKACEMLQKIAPVKDLEKYYEGNRRNADDLETVYKQLLHSAQNAQRMPNVIQYDNREPVIRGILHNYDFEYIKSLKVEDLYYTFRNRFNVVSKDSKMNLWYKWSTSVIDSARFISQFRDIQEFNSFVDKFQKDQHTIIKLPRLISSEIYGIGFALACDFLKELGYLNYCKPDVHILDICEVLGVSKRDPYEAFDCLIAIAQDNGISPYRVDKVFWLICSGNFYKDGIRIASHKEELIKLLKSRLSSELTRRRKLTCHYQ